MRLTLSIISLITAVFSHSQTVFQDSTGLYGYKMNNTVIIAPQFDQAYSFHNNHAQVSVDGLFGLIDTKGNWYVDPKFNRISPLVNSSYIGFINGQFEIYVDNKLIYKNPLLNIKLNGYKLLLQENLPFQDVQLVLRIIEMIENDKCPDGNSLQIVHKSTLESVLTTKWVLDQH